MKCKIVCLFLIVLGLTVHAELITPAFAVDLSTNFTGLRVGGRLHINDQHCVGANAYLEFGQDPDHFRLIGNYRYYFYENYSVYHNLLGFFGFGLKNYENDNRDDQFITLGGGYGLQYQINNSVAFFGDVFVNLDIWFDEGADFSLPNGIVGVIFYLH